MFYLSINLSAYFGNPTFATLMSNLHTKNEGGVQRSGNGISSGKEQ